MIRMKHLLTEAVTIQGVLVRAKSPKTGGPLLATYQGVTHTYSVKVNTMFYDGPVGIVSIWEKRAGEYAIKDNTGKTFDFDKTDIGTIIDKIKREANTISISKTAAEITLTRTA